MAGDFLTIGELGRRTDTKVETIRYYDRIGLLAAPSRTAGNYRAYDAEHLNRLSFIRRSRDLGFSLDQVRALLDLADQRDRSCETVDAIAKAHGADPMGTTIDDMWITYVHRTTVFGFPDYISVKAVPEGDGAALIVWSRSRYGHSDLGVNKERIDAWLAQIGDAG